MHSKASSLCGVEGVPDGSFSFLVDCLRVDVGGLGSPVELGSTRRRRDSTERPAGPMSSVPTMTEGDECDLEDASDARCHKESPRCTSKSADLAAKPPRDPLLAQHAQQLAGQPSLTAVPPPCQMSPSGNPPARPPHEPVITPLLAQRLNPFGGRMPCCASRLPP